MFFKPVTVASMVAASSQDDGSPYKLYSDLHKEAFGCRPGQDQMERYNAMSPIERIVEHKRLGEWMAEGERIRALSIEVARFQLSRRMEYLQRREGLLPKQAFLQILQGHNLLPGTDDWEYICYCLDLPYEDAVALKEFWEEVSSE